MRQFYFTINVQKFQCYGTNLSLKFEIISDTTLCPYSADNKCIRIHTYIYTFVQLNDEALTVRFWLAVPTSTYIEKRNGISDYKIKSLLVFIQ